MMKISYNLTKRTTKTEKFEKYLKIYVINFKTKVYELTASGNIINSILNYKLKRLVSSLGLPKEQKQAKTAISRKKIKREKSRWHENTNFSQKNLFMFRKCFNRNGIFLFYQYNFKKSNMNKYIRHEIFEKTRSINAIKFISFQRNPLNTRNYASIGQQVCLSFIFHQ